MSDAPRKNCDFAFLLGVVVGVYLGLIIFIAWSPR